MTIKHSRVSQRVLVINPNTSRFLTDTFHPILSSLPISDHIKLSYWTCPSGPAMISSLADMYESASHCLPLLLDIAHEYDGFLAACYADHPLVRQLQIHMGDKPVVGIFDASIYAALRLLSPGSRFGIITTGLAYEALLTEGVKTLLGRGHGDVTRFAGVAASGIGLADIVNNQHQPDMPRTREKIMQATAKLLQSGRQGDVNVLCMGGVVLVGMEGWVRDACEAELGPAQGRKIKVVDQLAAGMLTLDALLCGRDVQTVDYCKALSAFPYHPPSSTSFSSTIRRIEQPQSPLIRLRFIAHSRKNREFRGLPNQLPAAEVATARLQQRLLGYAYQSAHPPQPPRMTSPRLRDQRPCDACRTRKARCLFSSDDAFVCDWCNKRSIDCTYLLSSVPKKRALPAPDDTTSQKQAPYSRRRKHTHDTKPVLTNYAQLSGNSLLKETLGHKNRESILVIGATTDFDPSLTRSLSWNTKGELPNFRPPQTLRRPNPTTHFMTRPDSQEEIAAELVNLDAIENFVRPHGPELVRTYFRIVHPSFPILHKNVFLEKYGRSYRELTPVGLGAVYILAMNWWSYSTVLSNSPKPDAKELESKVLSMLFDSHRRPKISDLQGGLVLMQSPNAGSWALTGHLVAMGQNLGINVDCTDWQVPDWERGVRKRVAWALFMQDKWSALIYGRGSHIRLDDWDVKPLELSDFPETAKDDDSEEGSADIEKGKKTFLHMVALTEIVSDTLDSFFTLKALRAPTRIEDVLDKAKPIQLRLKAWHANMPPGLSVDDTVPRKLSSVGYLHLAYYTAEITLHRAILRCHASSTLPADAQLHVLTRKAAEARFTSALEFVKRLKAEHFQSFWYFSSSASLAIIGIFAGILCITSQGDDVDEDVAFAAREDYMTKLAEYRWVLRVSSTGAEFMKYAVGVLGAQIHLLEEQFGKNAKRVGGSGAQQEQSQAQQMTTGRSGSTWSPDAESNEDGLGTLEGDEVAGSDDNALLVAFFDQCFASQYDVSDWVQQTEQVDQ
ncbi:hypothetical protein S40293_08591 [Stachybotrys chartarum IBT 40293]|nr:hypothetical protein S40293_08591 [Stachybotrys chartarum IBT 40293]